MNVFVAKPQKIETATSLNYAVMEYAQDHFKVRTGPEVAASGNRTTTEFRPDVGDASNGLLPMSWHVN